MLFKKQRNLLNLNWGASLALFAAISLFSAPAAQAQSGPSGRVAHILEGAEKTVFGLWKQLDGFVLVQRNVKVVEKKIGFEYEETRGFLSVGDDVVSQVSPLVRQAKTKIDDYFATNFGVKPNAEWTAQDLFLGSVTVKVQVPNFKVAKNVQSYFNIHLSDPVVPGSVVPESPVKLNIGQDTLGKMVGELEIKFRNPYGSERQSQILRDWGIF